MFIALTVDGTGEKRYYNVDYIKTFEKYKLGSILTLTYGNSIVKETPDEIMEMLKSRLFIFA